MVLLAIVVALQTTEPEAPVSLARVRARLARPAILQIRLPELPRPTFRVEVREHPFWTDEPLTWNWETPPMSPLSPRASGWPSGLGAIGGSVGGTDVLPLITAARRSLQKRAAHKEVQKVLAEFCASRECSSTNRAPGETREGIEPEEALK